VTVSIGGLVRSSRATDVARIWYAVIATVISVSFVIQLVILFTGGTDVNSGSSASGLGLWTRVVRLLSYFTIESNLIVLAVVITLLIRPDRDGAFWRVVRLDALLGIVITGLVFAFVLDSEVHLTGAALAASIGFHYISPPATLLAWIFFGPRPRIRWHTVAAAFVWPALWIGYTFAHGAATGWYPYPFLDAAKKGYAGALTSTVVVVLIAVVLAVALKLLDRLPSPAYVRLPGYARSPD
jgi:hypothetical protein